MSKLLEFFVGSLLITILSMALLVFSMLHYVVKVGGIIDCAWHGSAKTWFDSNGDGLVNNGEQPVSEIEIHIDDVQNQLVDVGWPAVTDKNGDARLNVLMLGCSESLLEVYVNIPEGYRITTRPRVEVNRDLWGNLLTENVYYFGFISE
ncbi:MAG TPA: hypothetical protein VJ821_06120 [Anaerolineales bacterium]|nr:hypothetical protein [Anaerolineales bacterium]